MSLRATATCEITNWQETALDGAVSPEITQLSGGPKFSRVTYTKRFEGQLEGTSTTEMLMCGTADGSGGYVAQECIVGSLAGRSGTFVLHHGGTRSGGAQDQFGKIVPGSGHGELRGLSGRAEYHQDEKGGAMLILEYDLA